MEAEGVEPAPPQNANQVDAARLFAEVSGNSLSSGQLVVLWSALEPSPVPVYISRWSGSRRE